jgi:hypothetical protein
MIHSLFSRKSVGSLGRSVLIATLGSLALALVLAVLTATPAHAETAVPLPPSETTPPSTTTGSVDTSMCTVPTFEQAFLYAKDLNWYTLVPGQSFDNFDGEGWELSNGAQLVTTTLADGSTGQVLDLPSGSQAVSPTICVTSEYPTARTIVRNVAGSDGAQFYVSYEGTKSWSSPKATGKVTGDKNGNWTVSSPVSLQPYKTEGWQRLRIILVGGKASETQLYNLYVDPRMS